MKITQKGQVTLPKNIRKKVGLEPGMEVEFIEKNGQIVLRKKSSENPFEKSRGLLQGCGWKHTDDLINALRGRA